MTGEGDILPRFGLSTRARWVVLLAVAGLFFGLEFPPSTGRAENFVQDLDLMVAGYESGSVIRQAALFGLGALGAVLLTRGAAPLHPRGALPWLVLSYAVLVTFSIAWSDAPFITAKRLVSLALVATAAFALTRRLALDDVGRFVLLASSAYLSIALGVELWRGEFHPFAPGYRFAGVYHPNALGTYCALLALAAATSVGRAGRRWPAVVLAATALVFLVFTRSRTSLAAAIVSLAIVAVVRARASRVAFGLVVAGWVLCGALLFAGEDLLPKLTSAFLMDRPDSNVDTLSGRTDLWSALVRHAAERPVLGYGLGAFWTVGRANEIYRDEGWAAAHAHSTYLSQLLSIGYPGLAVYLGIVVVVLRRAFRIARGMGPAFPLALVVYCVLVGFLETVDLGPTYLAFVFLWVAASFAVRDESVPTVAPADSVLAAG